MRFSVGLVCVGLFVLVTPVSAQVATATDASIVVSGKSLARKIVEASHIGETAKAFRKMLLAPTALPDCGGDEETKQKMAAAWQTAVSVGFNEDGFVADVERQLAERLQPEALSTWLAFYETSLGRRIRAAEMPDLQDKTPELMLAEYSQAGKLLNADPARKRVIERIANVAGSVDASVDAMLGVALGTALGSNASMPKGQPRLDHKEVLALVEAQRPVMRAAISEMMVPMLGNFYRDLTLAELRGYLSELSSQQSRDFIRAFRSVFNDALRRQALNIGAVFAKEFTATKA
jgi:hypothetical protein